MTTKAPDKIECPHCHKMTSPPAAFVTSAGWNWQRQALKPVTAAQVMATGELDGAGQADLPILRLQAATGRASLPELRQEADQCRACGAGTVELKGPPSALKVGLLVAERYGIEGLLGQGGMGRAWKAYDRNLNKYVVIKTVVADDPACAMRCKKKPKR